MDVKDTVESRAVKIAAKIMRKAGLCRYADVSKCRHVCPDENTCVKCIRSWLLSKARKELKQNERQRSIST